MSLIGRVLDGVARAIHRVVHPQHAEERQVLERISRAISEGASADRQQLERLSKQVEGLSRRLEGVALDRDLRGLHQHMEDLRHASTRQRRMISQGLMYAKWQEERRLEERRIDRRVETLAGEHRAGEKRRVLVGPWSGEVGFELLYWIPFVTWALKKAAVSPERVVVVSRGGPASWYAHIGGRYVDLLSHVSPEEFRARTERAKKQRTIGPFDREMVRRIIRDARLGRPFLLHPGLMYKLFLPFWKEQLTVRRIDDYSRYQTIAAPVIPALAGRLPSSYVAVRFYFSSCFPDTAENRAFVESTVRSLAATTDVVMLNTGIRVDDHQDYSPGRHSRIHSVDDLMTPDRNLEVQTAVIANAHAFVGTYGGYSYLAPLCRVPAIAFYSERDAFYALHRELAERMIREVNGGSLVTLAVKDAALVRDALGAAQNLHA
jgi:hypothetical protein